MQHKVWKCIQSKPGKLRLGSKGGSWLCNTSKKLLNTTFPKLNPITLVSGKQLFIAWENWRQGLFLFLFPFAFLLFAFLLFLIPNPRIINRILPEAVRPYVDPMLQALANGFNDTSWQVRAEACKVCGDFITSFPNESKDMLQEELYQLSLAHIGDEIWSVRLVFFLFELWFGVPPKKMVHS